MTHATVLQNYQSMEYDILWCVCVDQRLGRNLAVTSLIWVHMYVLIRNGPASAERILVGTNFLVRPDGLYGQY